MRIFFVNNDGAGFCDHLEIAGGSTVRQLFAQQIKHGQPSDYLIRVNRQAVPADQVLQEGTASASRRQKSRERRANCAAFHRRHERAIERRSPALSLRLCKL